MFLFVMRFDDMSLFLYHFTIFSSLALFFYHDMINGGRNNVHSWLFSFFVGIKGMIIIEKRCRNNITLVLSRVVVYHRWSLCSRCVVWTDRVVYGFC